MNELSLSRVVWRKSSRSGQNGACVEIAHVVAGWQKSSHSGGNGNCVEVATYTRPYRFTAVVRDSKDPEGPVLSFRPDEWTTFTQQVKAGVHDL